MILTDAGPLIALIRRDEPDHDRCTEVLGSLTGPMLTSWPAFTEAVYLLGKAAGWKGQESLWRLVLRDDLQIAELGRPGLERTRRLMEQYQDRPMDLADATLVALAEARDLSRIFTLDHDFATYRLPKGHAFEIVPT